MKEMFGWIYNWGRYGVVVDHNAPIIRRELRRIKTQAQLDILDNFFRRGFLTSEGATRYETLLDDFTRKDKPNPQKRTK